MLHVLVVDSDTAFVKALQDQLEGAGDVRVDVAGATQGMFERLRGDGVDLVFLSSELKEAMGALEEVKRSHPDLDVVLTATNSRMEIAVRAMKLGASDYLAKPLRAEQVAMAIERARRIRRLSEENRRLREQLRERASTQQFVGHTMEMQRVHEQIARAAQTDSCVLFVGEPGTGKEQAARAVHQGGARREHLFVHVDCRGGRPEILESEIVAAFQKASGGAVFLDEVADLPLALQTPVARVIVDRVIRPSGASADIAVDARIMASSSRNVLEAVGRGSLRQDLVERLSVTTIALPALRERLDDVPLLVDAFLKRRAASGKRAPRAVSADALSTLMAYSWPGTVHELGQAVDRACELGEGDVLERRHLPPTVIQEAEARRAMGDTEVTTRSLREMESEVIQKLLTEHRGNTEIVSKLLKIDRSTLYRKIKRYGIPLDDLKE
ncbi:MAG: sigma-54-dependent Fis family transcriptional regulator [Planctomycetes bacterium]|nr:sigma-54-dependent Fis family transcriptional regulator [Planctomycetota bacterium]